MTRWELLAAIAEVGWSSRELARQLGVSRERARRWHAGDAPIPDSVAKWLSKLARAHATLPAPDITKD